MKRRQYVIDVCIVCGEAATYPFRCGHRSETELWTVPITVTASAASMQVLRAIAARESDYSGEAGSPGSTPVPEQ